MQHIWDWFLFTGRWQSWHETAWHYQFTPLSSFKTGNPNCSRCYITGRACSSWSATNCSWWHNTGRPSTTGLPPTAADDTSQDNQAATGVPATAADDTPHSQQPPNGSLKRMGDEHSRVSKRSKLDSPDKEILDNIDVGTEFLSYGNLQDAILRFERNNFVQLYNRSSRSLTAHAKKSPKKKLNADLVFSEIDCLCPWRKELQVIVEGS